MVSAFSIGKSQRTTYQVSTTPGPGAYNPIKKQKMQPPSYKIGSGARSGLLKTFAPGPGAYEAPDKVSREGPRYTFGSKKGEALKLFSPGPGAYNPNYRVAIKALPLYTMGSRWNFNKSGQSPGPGMYENKSTVADVPSMKFPHSQRLGLYNTNKVPGPGSYVSRSQSAGPKYRFGSGTRSSRYGPKIPGPGEYESQSDFRQNNKKGFSMPSRRSATQGSEAVPGPGSYNWDKKQKQTPPSYKIGSESRGDLSREQLRVPGPGTYESRFEYARPRSAQVRIGSATRRPLQDGYDGPGPGSYDINSRVGEGPKIQMHGTSKYDPQQSQQQPGPGTYNPTDGQLKQRPQSAKIGTGARTDMQGHKESPGVGNYNIRGQADGPRWGFGSSLRPPLSIPQDNPGPGGYNLKSTVADVPKYLLPNPPHY